jgi:hypothetical protein
MNCSYLRQNASLYIDRQLSPDENQAFFLHINSCGACFDYVDELRQTTQLLQGLKTVAPPQDLAKTIVAQLNAAHVCKPAKPSFKHWLTNTFFYNRPQYVSYAASFVLTCLLFTSVMHGFKPGLITELKGSVTVIFGTEEYLYLPTPPPTETLASFEASKALDDLVKAQVSLQEEDLFLVADVSSKGKAKLVEVVDSPKNNKLERRLDKALKKASFKPATKGGKPVNSRLFLLIQTIDVRG